MEEYMARENPVMSSSGIPLSWWNAVLFGIPASTVAILLMFWARSAYQIRTLPERMMEWALQFVPTAAFEQGIQTFGTGAKELALIGNYVGFAITLIVIAALALRTGPRAFVVVAIATWLLAMAIVMPITGAGFFASDLPQDVWLTNASYLAVAAAFGTVLALTHALVVAPRSLEPAAAVSSSRRAFVGG